MNTSSRILAGAKTVLLMLSLLLYVGCFSPHVQLPTIDDECLHKLNRGQLLDAMNECNEGRLDLSYEQILWVFDKVIPYQDDHYLPFAFIDTKSADLRFIIVEEPVTKTFPGIAVYLVYLFNDIGDYLGLQEFSAPNRKDVRGINYLRVDGVKQLEFICGDMPNFPPDSSICLTLKPTRNGNRK